MSYQPFLIWVNSSKHSLIKKKNSSKFNFDFIGIPAVNNKKLARIGHMALLQEAIGVNSSLEAAFIKVKFYLEWIAANNHSNFKHDKL